MTLSLPRALTCGIPGERFHRTIIFLSSLCDCLFVLSILSSPFDLFRFSVPAASGIVFVHVIGHA